MNSGIPYKTRLLAGLDQFDCVESKVTFLQGYYIAVVVERWSERHQQQGDMRDTIA
jgi:hypothetical protein